MEPAKAMSQKEYLKRYLMKDKKPKTKKKKPNISSSTHLKRSVIIDDDINISEIPQMIDDHISLDHLGDEAPQIVGIVDERPEEVKLEEKYKSGEWRPMGDDQERTNLEKRGESIGGKRESHLRNDAHNYPSPPEREDFERDKRKTRHERVESQRSFKSDDDSDLSPPRHTSGKVERKKDNSNSNADRKNPKLKSIARNQESSRVRRIRGNSEVSPPLLDRRKDHSDKNRSDDEPISKSARLDGKMRSRKVRNSGDEDSKLSPPRSNRKIQRRKSEMPLSSLKSKSSRAPPSSSESSDSDLEARRKRTDTHRSSRNHADNRGGEDSSDLSPPRKGRQLDVRTYSRTDKREKRRKGGSESDLSPPRRKTGDEDGRDRRKRPLIEKSDQMQDGKRAGLQDAKSLKDELRILKEKEDEMFRKMDPEIMGRSTTAIVRDRKTGLKRNFEKEREIEKEKAAKNAVRQEKYSRWGKGLKQVKEQEERVLDMIHEMSKPLARYAGDDDLERALKAQEREGDPMLDYIRKHQKESHSIDLTVGGVRKKYLGSYLPNRLNIPPGHRWDGVDRSNGYEQKWFEARNSSKATAEEAWKWSSADM